MLGGFRDPRNLPELRINVLGGIALGGYGVARMAFGGCILVAIYGLGVIHETPRPTASEQEENEPAEALSWSLSLMTNQPAEDSPHPPRASKHKAPNP